MVFAMRRTQYRTSRAICRLSWLVRVNARRLLVSLNAHISKRSSRICFSFSITYFGYPYYLVSLTLKTLSAAVWGREQSWFSGKFWNDIASMFSNVNAAPERICLSRSSAYLGIGSTALRTLNSLNAVIPSVATVRRRFFLHL